MRTLFIITISLSQLISAEKPIILWDLHGVLLQRENVLSAFSRSPNIYNLMKEINWPFVKDIAMALYTNYSTNTISSQDFINLAHHHNAPFTKTLILAIVNAQKPMPGMQAIIQELANLGYRQQIGSNIGITSFQELINPMAHPDLAPLFSLLEIKSAHIADYLNGQLIKKPNPAFFQNYLAKNNIDLATQPVLLIDDTLANTIAAQKLGFDVIYFKHPHKLRDELIKRGITIMPPAHHLTDQAIKTDLYDRSLFYR